MGSTKKRSRVEIRLDDETLKNLVYCTEKLEISKTDAIKQGLSLLATSIKKENG